MLAAHPSFFHLMRIAIRSWITLPVMATAGAGMLFFGGCAGNSLPAGSRFVVSTTSAQFFKNGPAQEVGFDVDLSLRKFSAPDSGADFSLPKGSLVTVVSRESGYSRVSTENGMVGYIANDQLQPAPAPAMAIERVSHPVRRDARPSTERRTPVHRLPEPALAPDRQLDMRDLPLPQP